MAFSVSAAPNAFTLAAGGSQEVVFTFTGVPGEITGNATVPFSLGAEAVTVALAVTLEEPDPEIGLIDVPAGVTAAVLAVDDSQATILFTR